MAYISDQNFNSFDTNRTDYLQLAWLLLGLLFLIMATITTSVTVLLVANNEWELLRYFDNYILEFVLPTFPFLLLIPALIGLTISIIFFRISAIARHYSLFTIVSATLFSSFFLAMLLYYSGIAAAINNLAKQISVYGIIEKNHQTIWQRPDLGLLSGKAGVITDVYDFIIVDNNNKTWKIRSKNPRLTNQNILHTGNHLKLIGQQIDDKTFEAKEIKQ